MKTTVWTHIWKWWTSSAGVVAIVAVHAAGVMNSKIRVRRFRGI